MQLEGRVVAVVRLEAWVERGEWSEGVDRGYWILDSGQWTVDGGQWRCNHAGQNHHTANSRPVSDPQHVSINDTS